MNSTIYTIKTHNPLLLFLVTFGAIISSVWLLQNYDRITIIIISVSILFLALAFCNYFLGINIEIQLTEKGIATTWAKLPFFIKSYEEVPWADIIDWDFESWRMADTFYIKTKENQKLYIRCLNLFKRQDNLDDFLKTFQDYYSAVKSRNKQSNNEISDNDIPFMAKPIGRTFALAFLIVIIVGVYIVFVKNKTDPTSIKGLKSIFVFAVLLAFTVSAIILYFKNKKK
jgi:hypothetical protein